MFTHDSPMQSKIWLQGFKLAFKAFLTLKLASALRPTERKKKKRAFLFNVLLGHNITIFPSITWLMCLTKNEKK